MAALIQDPVSILVVPPLAECSDRQFWTGRPHHISTFLQRSPCTVAPMEEVDFEIPWSAQLDTAAPHGATVGQLLPPGFDRYVRVFHPLVRWEAEPSDRRPEPRIATWSQLASIVGLELGPTLTLRQLNAAFDTLEPTTGRIAVWEGQLEESTTAALYQALDIEDSGSYWFAFGLTTIIAVDDHRPMLFKTNSLEERKNVIDAVRSAGAGIATTAENVWSIERSWIINTDYDLTSTYVSCDGAAANRLLDNDGLEAVLVHRLSRVDDHADESVR